MADTAAIDRLVQETFEHCVKYLFERGIDPGDPVRRAARRVVWARYYDGEDAWDKLNAAIGELEDIVGRPAREAEI